MRALLLLVAFVATPFAVGVSQGKAAPPPFEDPANCGKHLLAADPAGRQAPAHGGIHGVMDQPCGGQVPPPATGTAVVGGRVYNMIDGRPGLPSWVVTLGGDVSGRAVTNSEGRYEFGSLPAGSYWVCIQVQDGWVQRSPTGPAPCPNGMGHVLSLADGEPWLFANFAMAVQ